jgi:hypothetical protein
VYNTTREIQRGLLSPAYLSWDCRRADGELVASGVYVYLVQIEDEIYKGKFTVLRK